MIREEADSRKVIEKVIAATKRGVICWRASDADFNQRFYAEWQGWKLTATWFQDETSFEMCKGGRAPFRASYRVMAGLHDAIFDQIDPDWRARLERESAERQRTADRYATECAETRAEILKL